MTEAPKRIVQVLRVLAAMAAPFALAGAALHITPTVVLHKHADVIRSTLPSAQRFFLRTVAIGRGDLERIRAQDDYAPDDPEVKFYYGTDATGAVAGVVLFPQVNTQHGPFEVGLTIGPEGTVLHATVTKATVETKPWAEQVVRAHLMDQFRGMRPGDDVTAALETLDRDHLGRMPYFTARTLAQAVERGLTLYQVLYTGQ